MRWGRMHEGIDIDCPSARRIAPPQPARSSTPDGCGGYGNLVVVDHGNGLSTAYAHASAILVSVGQTVSQGETVSLVGATGHVTGPHCTSRCAINGVAVDPLCTCERYAALGRRARELAIELTRWRSGSARQRSSRPSP